MKFFFLIAIASLVSSVTLHANGKKRPPVSITFHFEANAMDGKKMSIPVKTQLGRKFIQRSPSISTKDVIAYHAFVSPHEGGEYGVALRLSKVAAQRLRLLSSQRKGQYIIANVNGKVADMLLIDKMVDGRVITIWRGVDPKFLTAVNPVMPRIGESRKQWKARLKSERKKK